MNDKQIAMVKAAMDAGITSPKEIANFIAQISHESANLTRLQESFRYTKGIDQIPVQSARREGDVVLEAARQEALAGKPDRLAELMYGGRMGNTNPGDALNFSGKGYIQLTGKDNYRDMGKRIGVDLVANPELAATPENAAKIAIEFWKANVPAAAREDVTKATKAINGGDNGLAERQDLYDKLVKELTPELLNSIKTGSVADANVGKPTVSAQIQASENASADVPGFQALGTVIKQQTNEQFTFGVIPPDGRTEIRNGDGVPAFASLNPGVSAGGIQNFVNMRPDLKSAQDVGNSGGAVGINLPDQTVQPKPANERAEIALPQR
jgi:predicted chitinase